MTALTQTQHQQAVAFREWITRTLATGGDFDAPEHDDREDGSTLTTRWRFADAMFLQVSLRPLIPQVRVGIVTDDRWKSEEIEQAIQDSGDTMAEYLELGFDDAGLDWPEPPVEHYRDQGKWFSFITPLELGNIDELSSEDVRDKVHRMARGYLLSYGKL